MAGTITYGITKRDYIDAGRATFIRSLRKPRFLVRLAAIAIFGAAVGAGLGSWLGKSNPLMFAAVGTLYALLFILTILGGTYMLLPRRLGRLFDQHKTLSGDHGFGWDDIGVWLRSSNGTTTYRWAEYHDWSLARGLFLFYLNDELYHMVPGRAMTPEQRGDLYETTSREIGKAVVK